MFKHCFREESRFYFTRMSSDKALLKCLILPRCFCMLTMWIVNTDLQWWEIWLTPGYIFTILVHDGTIRKGMRFSLGLSGRSKLNGTRIAPSHVIFAASFLRFAFAICFHRDRFWKDGFIYLYNKIYYQVKDNTTVHMVQWCLNKTQCIRKNLIIWR